MNAKRTGRAFERELRRVFRCLAEPGAYARATADGRIGLYGPRGAKPAATVEPAVIALREHVLGVVQHEIDRARRRGDDGRVEEALRHLTSVLLHTPSTLARRHAAAGRGDDVLAAVRTLYGLEIARSDQSGVEQPPVGEAQAETRSSSASSASP